MTEYDATELAYKNGFSSGRERGICEVISVLLKKVKSIDDFSEIIETEEMKCYCVLKKQIYLDIIAYIRGNFLQ